MTRLPAHIARVRLAALVTLHGLSYTRCGEQMGRGRRWLTRKLLPPEEGDDPVTLTAQDIEDVLLHLGEPAERFFSMQLLLAPEDRARLDWLREPRKRRAFVLRHGRSALRRLTEQGLVVDGDPLTLTPAGLALIEGSP